MSNILNLSIKVNKLYFMPSKNVVRVVRINNKTNNVIIRNYHSHTNESIDLVIANSLFKQAFRISEVSRVVGRKPVTIRKYEHLGLIPKAKKVVTKLGGERQIRVYSQEDVDDLVNFFNKRRPVGRPNLPRIQNKTDVKQRLNNTKMKG